MEATEKHCGLCGKLFAPEKVTVKWCSLECKKDFDDRRQKAKGETIRRFCWQCGKTFPVTSQGDRNRWHCSSECATRSAKESRSKFYYSNPTKDAEYRARSKERRGPDGNLPRLYRRYPDAPRACQACGENRVLDMAHKPEFRRMGAWRTRENSSLDKIWALCPTCHALLDRMNYSPEELGLVA